MKKLLNLVQSICIYVFLFTKDVMFDEILNNAGNINGLMNLFFPSIASVFVLLCICWLNAKKQQLRYVTRTNQCFAILFTLGMYVGKCFSSDYKSVFLAFSNVNVMIPSICCVWGGYLVVMFIIGVIRQYLPKLKHFSVELKIVSNNNRVLFFRAFIIILLCWLPYIITRYPAGIEYDAYYQIQQGMGLTSMEFHFPPFSSWLMGIFVRLGLEVFHSINIGAFLFVVFQTIISVGILAYTLVVMKKLKVSRWLVFASLAIYALVPLFPGYLTSIVKDALFAVFVLLFLTLLAEDLLFEKNAKRSVLLAIASLLVCLLRHNGIYLLIACMIIAIPFFMASKKRYLLQLMVTIVPAIVIYGIYLSVILPAMGITQTEGAKEMMSIPFQQTARIARDRGGLVTEDEKEWIDRVLVYDELSESYNPLLSDPVKGQFHGNGNDVIMYLLKAWLPQLIRHPSVYIDATLENTYGFFYPDTAKQFNKIWSGVYLDTRNMDILQFDEPDNLQVAKRRLLNIVRFLEWNPLTMAVCNLPLYMWVVIYLFLDSLFKHDKIMLLLLVPSVVGILVCIASPTWWNNGFRYAIPVVYSVPFLVANRLRKV